MSTPTQNKSLVKALNVLKTIIISKKPLTANVLCQELGIDKSTMSRIVTTLMSEGFLEYKGNSKEIIASDFIRDLEQKESRDKIIEKTETLLDQIFYMTDECAYIGILDNHSVLYLNQIDKSNRVLKTRNSIGLNAPLHTNGFGKVILAFGEVELKELEMKKFTNNTITKASKLQEQIDLVRQRGYAIGFEEHEFGLCSIAVPYFNSKQQFIGAVGISGLSVRLPLEKLHKIGQELVKLVGL